MCTFAHQVIAAHFISGADRQRVYSALISLAVWTEKRLFQSEPFSILNVKITDEVGRTMQLGEIVVLSTKFMISQAAP